MRGQYIGVGSVSAKTAENILNVFDWMIQCFAVTHCSTEQLLYPESEESFFTDLPPDDEIMRNIWIGKRFIEFKDWCNMSAWPMAFEAEPDDLVTRRKGRTQQNRLSEVHGARHDEKYYVDDFGRPVFYYNRNMSTEPGYINYRIIKKLADQLHKTGPKPLFIRKTSNTDLFIACGAFIGLGHFFCAANRVHKKLFRFESEENIAAFSLAVYLALNGFSKNQALQSYGQLMSRQTKRDLRIAYKQLFFYKRQIRQLRADYSEKTTPVLPNAA